MTIDSYSTALSTTRILMSIYGGYRGLLSERIGSKVTVPAEKYVYILQKSAPKTVEVYRILKSNPELFDMIEIIEDGGASNA